MTNTVTTFSKIAWYQTTITKVIIAIRSIVVILTNSISKLFWNTKYVGLNAYHLRTWYMRYSILDKTICVWQATITNIKIILYIVEAKVTKLVSQIWKIIIAHQIACFIGCIHYVAETIFTQSSVIMHLAAISKVISTFSNVGFIITVTISSNLPKWTSI